MTQASNASLSNESAAKEPEYVDLIDVIARIWKSKVWMITGALLGLTTAAVVGSNKPLTLVTTILPVTIDLPGPHTQERILTEFNHLINRQDFQKLFAENLGEEKKSLLLDEKSPFQLGSSFGLYYLEIRQYRADSDGAMQFKIGRALAETSRKINDRLAKEPKHEQELLHTPANTDIEATFASLASSQAEEDAPVRMELYLLEKKLIEKLGIQSSSAPKLSTAIAPETGILNLLATSGKKLSKAERIQFIKQYSALVGQLKSNDIVYQAAFRDLSDDLLTISRRLIEHATHATGNVLVISIDENAYRTSILTGKHLRVENKKPIFYTFSVIFGGLLGFTIYAAKLYFQKNREYFRAKFQSPS